MGLILSETNKIIDILTENEKISSQSLIAQDLNTFFNHSSEIRKISEYLYFKEVVNLPRALEVLGIFLLENKSHPDIHIVPIHCLRQSEEKIKIMSNLGNHFT